MKKNIFTTLVAVLIFVLLSSVTAFAATPRVMLDGEYVDVDPIIINGRTLMPARQIVELLGGNVEWYGPLRQVTITHYDTTVLLRIDNPVVTINGTSIIFDVSPQIVNDLTKVPLRIVAYALGVDVDFRDGTVFIYTTGTIEPEQSIGVIGAPIIAHRSEYITLSFQGEPNTQYELLVWSAAGNLLTAEGLGYALSDANGVVSWTWLVGSRTGAGYQRIMIKGGDKNIEYHYHIKIIVD